MKTLLLNVYKNQVEEIEIEDDLDAFYQALGCDMIEIPTRYIAGKPYSIMCDEEGLMREDVRISAISDFGEIRLVGNLMFFNDDGEGHLLGLSDADIKHIRQYIQTMYTNLHPEGYLMLTQCEYSPQRR